MLDAWIIIFTLLYGFIAILCFTVAFKKFLNYRKYSKNKKPNLTIIDGGKKERGPYA
jgi:NADH:ubiquinone oxidoreductase subunit 3 (subunit A)